MSGSPQDGPPRRVDGVHAPRYGVTDRPSRTGFDRLDVEAYLSLRPFSKGVRGAQGSIVALIAVAIVVVLVGVMISFRPRVATSATAAVGAAERTEDPGESSTEGEEPEGEDPAREAEEHVGAAVTAEEQSRITRAEARSLAPLAPAPGWAGEIKLGVEDTWEPTIAADPNAAYVYVMYNRFGGPKACNKCPGTPMYVRVSANNGVSWGAETYLCPCSGVKFQYDPVLKVASNGVVYATFMNGYDMMFSKSSDHGTTWTAPIEVSAKPWGDKPWIGVSPNGTDVYIAYETASDVWVAASHNGGTSFAAAVKLNTDTGRYRYPNGLEVLPNGTALLSASSYPGSQPQAGAVDIEIWRTTNGGTSWARTILATPFSGVTWETSSTTALASDAAGNLVALYTGATALGGNGHVWMRRSTDSGATWAAAVELGNGIRERELPGDRRRRERRLPPALRRQPDGFVERVLPILDGRRGHVERGGRHLRRGHGRHVQDRGRVHVGVRRLRRDRRHEHRQDGGGLGRGRELLGRPRRHLVQPHDLSVADSGRHRGNGARRCPDRGPLPPELPPPGVPSELPGPCRSCRPTGRAVGVAGGLPGCRHRGVPFGVAGTCPGCRHPGACRLRSYRECRSSSTAGRCPIGVARAPGVATNPRWFATRSCQGLPPGVATTRCAIGVARAPRSCHPHPVCHRVARALAGVASRRCPGCSPYRCRGFVTGVLPPSAVAGG